MKTAEQAAVDKDGFRLRGLEVTRLEGFSDAVFAFAVTLLVVSLDVPKTYADFHANLRGFAPFSICFLFLLLVWHSHYKFFRRFGLNDLATIWLNGALLFVTLFYVYPLKFLFTVWTYGFWGESDGFFQNPSQVVELMVLYGLGFAAIRLLVAGMYWNGYRQRGRMELSPLEQALTRGYIFHHALIASVGLISCVVAVSVPAHYAGLAGWVYLLIWLAERVSNWFEKRQIRRVGTTDLLLDANADTI